MMLDDVYGGDTARFSLERKTAWRDQLPPELEWDESEVAALVDQFVIRHSPDD